MCQLQRNMKNMVNKLTIWTLWQDYVQLSSNHQKLNMEYHMF